ncbi:hypothetical protein GCM10023238_17820 [Streptomyces heliomycini]
MARRGLRPWPRPRKRALPGGEQTEPGGAGVDGVGGVGDRAARARGEDRVDVAADVVEAPLWTVVTYTPAGPQHAGALGDDRPYVLGAGHQVQQPHADDGVELSVAEGQPAAVGADHGARQTDGGHPGHRRERGRRP